MKRDRRQVEITDQGRAFFEKARELGCDYGPAAFDRLFDRIVPPKRKLQERAADK